MRFRLLGPVEIQAGEQRHSLRSAKARVILAALAWDARQWVSTDTLIHRAWDELPPSKPKDSLYVYISRIRGIMRRIGGADAPCIHARAHAYVLDADPDTVDVRQYLSLVDQARALADSGSQEEALGLLDGAARLMTGDPLAGEVGSWAESIRDSIEEKALSGTLLRADIVLPLGRFAETATELGPVVGKRPTDESLVERYALALHGCGRTGEASRLLHSTHRLLLREFGTAPGKRLQAVQQGILAGSPVTDLLPSQHAARSRIRIPAPDNMPRDIPWVGREREITVLSQGLREGPTPPQRLPVIYSVDGMPGSGKTVLAVHLAHRLRDLFPDGRLLLNLRAHARYQEPLSAAVALAELLRLLGTPASQIPHDDLDALTQLWRHAMSERRALLVLDDARDEEQLQPLLPDASPVRVIITSRRRLTGLPDARSMSLDPMSVADALALFGSRIGADRAQEDDVREIARLCGYLPLAMEIAASRLLSRPSWDARTLIQRLSQGSSRLPEIRDAHRELAQAFDLSHSTLTPVQQSAFRRLGLHIGAEFGPHAAAALTGLPLTEAERVLESLLGSHLLIEPAPDRYRLHDLIRDYARALAETAESATGRQHALDRLLDLYLHTADRADRIAYPHRVRIDVGTAPPHLRALAEGNLEGTGAQGWFITEGSNLLAALDHAHTNGPPERAALMTHTLAGFLDSEGYLASAEQPLLRASSYWREAGDLSAEARSLLDSAVVHTHAARYEQAIAAARSALDIARATRDTETEAEALHQLAIPQWHEGRYVSALPHLQRSLSLRDRAADPRHYARALNMKAMTQLRLGKTDEAWHGFREALELFRATGDPRGELRALNNLAQIYHERNEFEDAERSYRAAMRIAQETDSRVDYVNLRMNFAATLAASGLTDESLRICKDILPVFRSVGDKRNEVITLNQIGAALQLAGRHEESIPYHKAALTLARQIHAATDESHALRQLGTAAQHTGRFQQAARHLTQSLTIARRTHARGAELLALRELEGVEGAPETPAEVPPRSHGH
ncbi:tetratricopeptide repeat protein [Streptomyces sp. NPDC054796]